MPSILYIEDEEDLRNWLSTAVPLTLHGFTVRTATNGVDAFRMLETWCPHLILLDLYMPRMNGFEFRRRQLADPRLAQIPTVIITAHHGDPREVAEELLAPVLQKPVDIEIVIQAIQWALQNRN